MAIRFDNIEAINLLNNQGEQVIALTNDQGITVSGTISSGAITSTGQITGTELEGTSLDINGSADISGNITGVDNLYADRVYINSLQTLATSSNFLYIDPSGSFGSGIYINNAVRVDGGLLGSYNEDLQLRTGTTTRLTLSNSDGSATFAGDVFSDGLYVNSTSAVSGTQVAIVADGNQNLQRWGSSSDGTAQASYRFRIDQNFKFIGNSGSGDTLTLDSTNGTGTFTGSISASNFSGSSSGTNTGDQTLPTLSSLGALSTSGGTITGDLTVNGKITQAGIIDREEWGRSYTVNVNAPLPLLTDGGSALPTGGAYRVTGHISGTGTEQVAVAVFWNENGTWYINKTFEGGTSSNHVEFKLFDHGSETVPTVTLESHTSNYSVHVAHERLSLEEGTGTDNLRGYFGSDSYLSWLESTNALTVPGTIAATNFSGSSSGTNTGDQTLPTLSSLGGASSGYLTNTGGAKLEIQNGQDGGSSYGIYMWTSSNTDWGIYMAQAGDNKALNDGTASAGIDGATSHAIRFRVNDSSGQAGFIWENNSNETLMQLNGGSEKLYTRNAIYPSNQTTNYVDSTRIANWQTAYGWGDHGLSTQDKTDITNLSGTNTGDQTFATLGAATRTNYTLTFKPPASSYAGFQFLNTSGNGAGYFLIRGTSDTDVYTAEGITLVADAGWLTLAQRTTSDKGIKFMTGATAATRMTIANDGDININNSLTVGSDLGVNGFIKDSLYKHAGNTNWRTKKYVRSVGITGGDIGDSWVQLSRVVISSTYEKVTIKFTINGYDDVSSGVEAIDVKYENGSTAQENHQCAWYSTDDNANLFKNVRSIRSASNGLSNTYDLYVQMAGDWRDNFTVVAEEWTTHGDNASIAYTTANGSATEPSAGSNDIERTERRWYTENSYMYLGSGRVYTTSDFTNNSSNWDTAYTDRNKWDGGSTGLTASTGRASLGLGTAATAAATAFATSGHNHAGVYALEYELMQSDNSDRDMHVWRKNHAMLSDDSGINTYIIVQTNVPQDNYSMGGFTLVYQDHYSSSVKAVK